MTNTIQPTKKTILNKGEIWKILDIVVLRDSSDKFIKILDAGSVVLLLGQYNRYDWHVLTGNQEGYVKINSAKQVPRMKKIC